ncbi:carbohydrate-binding protein [Cellvibrio fibrivorans]|uniref:Beta-glucanase (GH16 family) n=1 Tax=Cellvibrio fibrivorans TaxID=126350 RepID=A0ABU1UVM9_9GAMM|nr:carbohydrate-binding protein [Cellvibrio fibrivorans]MDR7089253.1 beta-glucanase (GH16 family) [Cellvibrio fibrivorans]
MKKLSRPLFCVARSLVVIAASTAILPTAYAAKSTAWEGNFHDYRVESVNYWDQENPAAKADDFSGGDPWSYKFKCDGSPWNLNTYWDKDGHSVTEAYEYPYMRIRSPWSATEAIVRDNTPAAQSFPLSDLSNKAGWRFVPTASDEFNQATLDVLKSPSDSTGKWVTNNHTWGGREPAPFLPKNVRQESGLLKLSLKQKVESQIYGFLNANFMNGWSAATAMNATPVRYGYFEVRSKVGVGSSAFWLYSKSMEDVRYIKGERVFTKALVDHNLEIDVYEQAGRRPEWAPYYNMNTWVFEYQGDDHRIFSKKASGQSCGREGWQGGDDLLPHAAGLQNGGHWKADIDFAADFHVYGLYWGPDELRWYVDGKLIRSMKNRYHHTPLYILLDTETMPDWFGLPTPAELQHDHEIDYVRVWTTDALENHNGKGWRAIQADGNARYSMRVAARDGDGHQNGKGANQPLEYLQQHSKPFGTVESYIGSATSGTQNPVKATAVNFKTTDLLVLSERRLSPYRAAADNIRYYYAHYGHVIDAIITPSNATNKNIKWVSDNPAIATVTASGVIVPAQTYDAETGSLTHIASGEVTLTGTHADLPGNVFTLRVKLVEVGSENSITLANFSTTGRNATVAEGYAASAVGWGTKGFPSAITDNTRGEFGSYQIDFGSGGKFSFMLSAGTPIQTGTGVKVFIDDEEVLSENLNNISGDWDAHFENWFPTTFTVSPGKHWVKIMSAGASEWQWFGHSAQFLQLLDGTNSPSSSAASASTMSSRSSVAQSSVAASSVPTSSAAPSSIAKSSIAPSSAVNSSVASSIGGIGAKVIVQAENFIATGGTYQGFQKYTTANGIGAINYNQRGDWADYSFTIGSAGTYTINAFLGTTLADSAIELFIDNVSVGKKTVLNNNNWDAFVPLTLNTGVQLSAGTHTLRVVSAGTTASTWEWNADRIEFTQIAATSSSRSSAASSSSATPTPIVVQAESYTTTGGAYQGLQKYTTATGVAAVNYNQRGDWADYTINVTATGNYRINAYLGTTQVGGAIEILVDGISVAKKTVPNNNNWDVFAALEVSNSVRLTQGMHNVRIISAGATASTWEWNADRIEFVPVN